MPHLQRWTMPAGAALAATLSFNAGAGVLYEQPPADAGSFLASAWWDPNGSDYDTYAWDGFVLPNGGTVTELHWRGGHDPAYWYYTSPVVNFTVDIWATSIAGEPDVAGTPLAHYETHGNAAEVATGTSAAGMATYDYQFVLPQPFVAQPGVKYWVQIEAWQHGIPDWVLAPGSGGDGHYFRLVHGHSALYYQWMSGDGAFWLADDLTVDSTDDRIAYQGWSGYRSASASGGGYRAASAAGSTVTFAFKGGTLGWVAIAGPDRGIAQVRIDGVARADVDLYAATAGRVTRNYSGLGTGAHTVVITTTGTHNPASSGDGVSVDAFKTSAATVQDSAMAVQYGSWKGTASANAVRGSYRSSATPGARATLDFTGTHVEWITLKGPGCGQAEVFIDGTSRGIVDLYAPAAQWQQVIGFDGLADGAHTLSVKVLASRNPSATGRKVVIDAFTVPG